MDHDDNNLAYQLNHRPQRLHCHDFIDDVWTEHRHVCFIGCFNFRHREINLVYVFVLIYHCDLLVRANSQLLPPNNTHSIVYLDCHTHLRLCEQPHSSNDVDISAILPEQDRNTYKFGRGSVFRPRNDHGASVHDNRRLGVLSVLPEVLHEPSW